MSGCANCGRPTPFDLRTKPRRPRKWCSEACRRRGCRTLACIECGAPRLAESHGDERRCVACNGKAVRAKTRQWIIDSYEEWKARYGEAPTATEWNLAQARGMNLSSLPTLEGRPERRWPSSSTVQNHFGSWNSMIVAMGDTPRKPGHRKAVAA